MNPNYSFFNLKSLDEMFVLTNPSWFKLLPKVLRPNDDCLSIIQSSLMSVSPSVCLSVCMSGPVVVLDYFLGGCNKHNPPPKKKSPPFFLFDGHCCTNVTDLFFRLPLGAKPLETRGEASKTINKH